MNNKFESAYDLEEGKIYRYLCTSDKHKITLHDSFFKVINIIDKYKCDVYVYNRYQNSRVSLKRNTWHLYGLTKYISGPYHKDEIMAKIL